MERQRVVTGETQSLVIVSTAFGKWEIVILSKINIHSVVPLRVDDLEIETSALEVSLYKQNAPPDKSSSVAVIGRLKFIGGGPRSRNRLLLMFVVNEFLFYGTEVWADA